MIIERRNLLALMFAAAAAPAIVLAENIMRINPRILIPTGGCISYPSKGIYQDTLHKPIDGPVTVVAWAKERGGEWKMKYFFFKPGQKNGIPFLKPGTDLKNVHATDFVGGTFVRSLWVSDAPVLTFEEPE